ncbi:competence type IV pilus assembly protein ComGB [Bacillus sp. AK128]
MNKRSNVWTRNEQVKLLKQLSLLLERGYPLLEALPILMIHLPLNKQTRLNERIQEMKDGISFHDALVKLSFHRDVLGYLFFAEKHGDLSFALKEASQLLEVKVSYYNRLIKILQYPLILIGITLTLIFMINHFLLPQFSHVFETMSIQNNLFLFFVMMISTWLPRMFLALLLSLLILSLIFAIRFKRVTVVERWRYLRRLPVYGSTLCKFYSQYFAMQLSQLLKGGLSVNEALSLFESQNYFTLFKEEASQIKKELRSGESLAAIIQSRDYFEEELSKSIAFGSLNGELARELYHYSKLSSEALEEYINKKIAIIQPSIFIAIGLMIMGIYMAIMQPVFQMLNDL